MPIHFTREGVFADTEEERLTFYDQQCAGDPVLFMQIELWRKQCEVAPVEPVTKGITEFK